MTNVWIVEGAHHIVPGRVVKVCATKDLADLEATALVNIILKDVRDDNEPLATAADWEDKLEGAKTTIADLYGCEDDFAEPFVEISEHEVIQ
jgi:hypothetical protein